MLTTSKFKMSRLHHPFNFIIIVLVFLALLNEGTAEDPKIEKFVNCLRDQFGLDTTSYVVTPSSNVSYYNVLNRQWNTRKVPTTPLAYFVPQSTFHVQSAVKCGRASGLPLIPNSGGHSYEALGFGDDFSVIVDLREMNRVTVSQDGKTAIMQPGLLLGPMISELWSKAKVSLPVGNCLTVGLGGHAVGGGVGFYSPRYGLLIDNILEYEMVDADGNAVRASATQNPDLFWGIRGMGAGYLGIVTLIKAKTFRADNIKLTWIVRNYHTSQFIEVVNAFQNWMDWVGRDRTVFSSYFITNDNYTSSYPIFRLGGGLQLSILHIHDPNDVEYTERIDQATFVRKARQIFPPSYRLEKVLTPSYLEHVFLVSYAPVITTPTSRAEEMTLKYLESLRLEDDPNVGLARAGEEVALPTEQQLLGLMLAVRKENAVPRYFRAKSQFVKRKLTQKELGRLDYLLARIPNNRIWVMVNSERGIVEKIPKNEMSYVHRNSLVDMSIQIETPEVNDLRGIGEAEEWFGEWFAAMNSFDGKETYQNYPDLTIPKTEAMKRYYGSNLDQVIATKAKWDPENYFKDPISIPLSL